MSALAGGWWPAARLALGCLAQWAALLGALKFGLAPSQAFALACMGGVWHLRPSGAAERPWAGKALRAGLFPVSYCLLGATSAMPPWIWGAAALAGLLVFPRLDRASAPLWRSPSELGSALSVALAGRSEGIGSALDAGCGVGDALLALRRALPDAEVGGIEAAALPWVLARLRCGPRARRGDMWQASWAGHDLVFLFLRPEAMAQAGAKCAAELAPQAWVASLEFEIPGAEPVEVVEVKAGRLLRLYQAGSLG